MRNDNSYNPEKLKNQSIDLPIDQTITRDWSPVKLPFVSSRANRAEDTEFTLKNSDGHLSYKHSDDGNYTNFLCISIQMLLAFNSSEIDPAFRKLINDAIKSYNNGEISDLSDDEIIEECEKEFDIVRDAIDRAKDQTQKTKEADKFIISLPKTESVKLRILYIPSELEDQVKKILQKTKEFSNENILSFMTKGEQFMLPFEVATELYKKLRILGAVLAIKPDKIEELTSKEKSSVKIKHLKTKQANKVIKKQIELKTLTGLEKLPCQDSLK